MKGMPKYVLVAATVVLMWFATSCGGGAGKAPVTAGDTITTHARLLTVVRGDGYTYAEVRSPWSDSVPLGCYTIIDSGSDADALPGTTLIRRPLRRSVVFASVHTAPIAELGSLDGIAAVADGQYFTPGDTIAGLLASGRIADVGSSMSPSLEKVIDLEPDAVLLSPYEDGNAGGLDRAGVPIIYMADYLEADALCRAEWLLLLGELYGRTAEADSMYAATVAAYESLKARVADVERRPTVFTEKPYSGVWYVPGGRSYAAGMLADAGARYVWADDGSSGSLPLDEAAVIDRASDADYWLIKAAVDTKPETLAAELPHARAFKAFPGGVYYCNTVKRPFFNAVAFHPERVLADYVRIFHPEVMDGDTTLQFFTPLK